MTAVVYHTLHAVSFKNKKSSHDGLCVEFLKGHFVHFFISSFFPCIINFVA